MPPADPEWIDDDDGREDTDYWSSEPVNAKGGRMFWPIFIYVMVSAAIAISAGINVGFWVALHAPGGSLLALTAGGGLRASLQGDRTQKIVER
jgi:hypothetical protein